MIRVLILALCLGTAACQNGGTGNTEPTRDAPISGERGGGGY